MWVSENVADLVIERNSDFRTEELSDEQLEQLGGLECVYFFALFLDHWRLDMAWGYSPVVLFVPLI